MSENTAYEPSAPEGAAPQGSQYLTKRDARAIGLVTVVLVLGFIPVFLSMRERAFKTTCIKNMSGVMDAIMLYATNSDDRYPPLFNVGNDGEPMNDSRGLPYTWVSDVEPYKSDRVSFVCPSASKDEYAYSVNARNGEPIPSTYGFYAPYATEPLTNVDSPETTVIIAETSNKGSRGSFDPLPYKQTDDGFVIGWDNSNFEADMTTKAVTRLSFRDSTVLDNNPKSGRHGEIIHAISASKQQIFMKSSEMQTEYNPATYSLMGRWRQPIKRK